MFVAAVKTVTNALFPILRVGKVSASQRAVSVGGSGFFIDPEGKFASVAHIFSEQDPSVSYQYVGRLPDNHISPSLPIQEVARDDTHDIYIGKVEIQTPNYLQLSKTLPDVGRSVCITGYPLAKIYVDNKGALQTHGIRRYFQPSFVLDCGEVRIKIGSLQVIYDGFLVRDFGLFGMSGGPVFDVNGLVLGVQAAVTEPRISEGKDGRKIAVENAIVARASRVLDLLQKAGSAIP